MEHKLFNNEIFYDEFWSQKIEWHLAGDICENEMVARIEGFHYVIGNPDALMKSPNVLTYKIKFIKGPHRGKIVETSNLWFQGEILQPYLEYLPDNAVFIYK